MSKEILIIPDIHGRTFWEDAVHGWPKDKPIIFLGDYVDCYPDEGITQEDTFVNFEKIIEFAKENSNVTLLLGNHDMGYINRSICTCRHDWARENDIKNLFVENSNLFHLACEKQVGEQIFLFTHAGIRQPWQEQHDLSLNEIYDFRIGENNETNNKIENALEDVSIYRGGINPYGSIVWTDIREFLWDGYPFFKNVTQIVGHTRCRQAFRIKGADIYMLDAQCSFYIDENGIVRNLGDDKEVIDLEL